MCSLGEGGRDGQRSHHRRTVGCGFRFGKGVGRCGPRQCAWEQRELVSAGVLFAPFGVAPMNSIQAIWARTSCFRLGAHGTHGVVQKSHPQKSNPGFLGETRHADVGAGYVFNSKAKETEGREREL